MRAFCVLLPGVIVPLALSMAAPACATPWCSTPLAKWSEGVTWDVNDQFPPPYGAWAEGAEGVTAEGKAPLWSTMLLPGDQGAAQKVSVTFTVDKSSGAKRQLPGGCVRWGFHWGENLPGWDVGLVLRYKDPLHFYRLQLSASRGELSLWDSSGGFLQLIPVSCEAGQPHTLAISARNAHFEASLDGKPVLDYWDRTLPHLSGQVGLAVYQSQVRFSAFSVSSTPAETRPMPPHQAGFSVETAEGVRCGDPAYDQATTGSVILFDGREPIGYFWPSKQGDAPANLFWEAVKLKPGWRPSYYLVLEPAVNYKYPGLTEPLPGAIKVDKQGETLALRVRLEDPQGFVADHAITAAYDGTRGVYRYTDEVKARYTAAEPYLTHQLELIDPLTYNNRMPGAEVMNKWSPSGHRWHVYQGPGGQWLRYPIVDYLGDYNNQETDWPKLTTFLYPDPAACPTWEFTLGWEKPEKRMMVLGQCTWGYDFHHVDSGSSSPWPAGTERNYTLTLTALLPDEAKALYEKSVLSPKIAAAKETPAAFCAEGTTFDKKTPLQDPTWTMNWSGPVDDTEGRADRHSARIDGPGVAGAFLYQYAFEQHAKRWWVRGWTKSQGVTGRGLQMRIKYSYQPQPEDVLYLDGRGNRDWTYFSFVTTVPKVRDCTSLSFELDGQGTVWLDDIAISALKEGEEPKLTEFPLPAELAPHQDLLIDLTMKQQPTTGVWDESYNGHHLMLHGPTWMQEQGRGFLRFNGTSDYALIPLQPSLEPRDGPPGSEYKPIFPLKEFTYELWARPQLPAQPGAWMMLFEYRMNPRFLLKPVPGKADVLTLEYENDQYRADKVGFETEVPVDQWVHLVATHGGGKVVLYVNGQAVGEKPYDPNGPGFGFFEYNWRYQIGTHYFSGMWYKGDLGPLRLYTKVLTPDEVKERYEKGWPEKGE
jgi:hypothetical protein